MTSEAHPQSLSFRRLVQGVGFACAGVAVLVRTQRSARIHLLFTLLVIALAAALRLDAFDWGLLVFSMSMVWTAEAANTAIEFLADVVNPSFHEGIKRTKDTAAAAVFFSVIGAVAVGLIVFAPPLLRLAGLLEGTPAP